jgi:hypothetical protein
MRAEVRSMYVILELSDEGVIGAVALLPDRAAALDQEDRLRESGAGSGRFDSVPVPWPPGTVAERFREAAGVTLPRRPPG